MQDSQLMLKWEARGGVRTQSMLCDSELRSLNTNQIEKSVSVRYEVLMEALKVSVRD